MKRRTFISQTVLSAIFLSPFFSISCKTGGEAEEGTDTKAIFNPDFVLDELTISALHEKVRKGIYTYEKITKLYLKRITEVDKKGPAIDSVIELNPEALSIAIQMDKEFKEGKIRSLLHGVPVLLKDNIDTGDKMMTTAGSLAMVGNVASKDAFIVQKLREAGAVILGKTNMTEWANFRSTKALSGWSSRGGQTKNPYVLDRSPCGSSSGSGAAVAANLCMLSIGTETNGSIACPASMNGVVGIKPTVGLVSRSGIIPISHTQDTAGPLTRTVTDAAIALNILAGTDDADSITNDNERKQPADYTLYLKEDSLKGKRIGVEKTFLQKKEGVDALLVKALEEITLQGATIVEVEFMDACGAVGNEEMTVLQYEFKDGLNKYLTNSNAKVKSLKDLIYFNSQRGDRIMPFFKQELLESSLKRPGLDNEEYILAKSKLLSTTRGVLDNLMVKNKLDAFCAPATGQAWCNDPSKGDVWSGYGGYGPAAIAGYPSITVPMGMVNELPIGLTFFSKAYTEPLLLGIAFAYEKKSKNRVKPMFKESVGKA